METSVTNPLIAKWCKSDRSVWFLDPFFYAADIIGTQLCWLGCGFLSLLVYLPALVSDVQLLCTKPRHALASIVICPFYCLGRSVLSIVGGVLILVPEVLILPGAVAAGTYVTLSAGLKWIGGKIGKGLDALMKLASG